MKIYYKGNKLTEIIIISTAILVAVLILIISKQSFWLILPYLILEVLIVYFLSNYHYILEKKSIKINYGFYTCKEIPIQSIQKIVIEEIEKGESKSSPYRINIYYGMNKNRIFVPRETVSFVENIERLRPDIEIS